MSGKCPSLPTGSPKKCIVTFHLMNGGMNEPPPQPRVRKVTTIVNTLGVVVRNSPSELAVWVLTACEEKIIPKSNNQHMFMNFHVGTWIIIGIYPDSTIASFSPWPLTLKAYETRVHQGAVHIKRKFSELTFLKSIACSQIIDSSSNPYNMYEREPNFPVELYYLPGFGGVIGSFSNRRCQENYRENYSCWLQYCGGPTNGFHWIVSQHDCVNTDEGGFKEKDLRNISDFIRDRQNVNDVVASQTNSVARHFGFVTEIFENKKSLHCWSPNVHAEVDHTAKIPQPPRNREVESEMLLPLIGQWIQYDVQLIQENDNFTMKSGRKLSIQEYLPINSPCGVGVVFGNRTVRVLISCIIVKSTDHPMLYELPTFGFVVDQKSSLVSGSHMQIVLEKTSARIRRLSGTCWKVVDSLVVKNCDVTIEETTEIVVEIIPIKDSMEVSNPMTVDKRLNSSLAQHVCSVLSESSLIQKPALLNISIGTTPLNSGTTSLKYQHISQHNNYEQRRDFYTGNNIQAPIHTFTRNSRNTSKPKSYHTGDKMEGHALVEKLQENSQAGILWFFEHSNSVHFIYDQFDLRIGSYAYVKLEKKTDPMAATGFRWMWKSGTEKTPPFTCYVEKNQIYIEDQLVYGGIDNQKRQFFRSSNFPNVLDADGQILNPMADFWYYVTLFRRKVSSYGNTSSPRYQWTISSVQKIVAAKPNYFSPPANNYRSYDNRQSLISSSAISDNSSKSPPLKSLSPPSDG